MKGFLDLSIVEKDRPAGLVPKCGACGIYKVCDSPKMRPYGEGRKKVLMVGEAPGEMEDIKGRPFVGKAGQFLREALEQIDIDLDQDALTTNALICRPPGNAKPDPKQIQWCRPNLLNTINTMKPNVVICLGHTALSSVLTDYWRSVGKFERWVGWKIPIEDFWICPTYHPSFLLRSRNELMDRQFVEHLRTAFDITEPSPAQPDWNKEVEVLFDVDAIREALQEMAESEWVAVDYETNCLKPDYPKAAIFACGMSNGRRTVAYPWRGPAIEWTGEVLRSKYCRKIASNLKMEEKWTRMEFGHGVRSWGWDTMIAAHCLDNRPGICSIKFQALIRLGVPSYNELIAPYLEGRGWYNRIHHIETAQLLRYCGMDCILEYRVAMEQRKEMGHETEES